MANSGVTSGAITSYLLEYVNLCFYMLNTSHFLKVILVLEKWISGGEFVGRFPILVSLLALTEDQLIRVT